MEDTKQTKHLNMKDTKQAKHLNMKDTKQTKHLKHGRYKTNQTFKTWKIQNKPNI